MRITRLARPLSKQRRPCPGELPHSALCVALQSVRQLQLGCPRIAYHAWRLLLPLPWLPILCIDHKRPTAVRT